VAFVCVENAGRSQMAAAFARQMVTERGLDGVEVHSGGTDPATAVHPVVVEAMAERGIDVSDREPRLLPREDVMAMDVVITMGCSAQDVCPATWHGDSRDWDLADPGEQPLPAVREIRDEIENRVQTLLNELRGGEREATQPSGVDPEF
jgi:protein-tyrosine-phosphatase